MIDRVKAAWAGRTPREQGMLGVMFALLAGMALWFGLIAPLGREQVASIGALHDATDHNAAVRSAVAQLKKLPRAAAQDGAASAIDQWIGQSAGEAGLTLDRAQAQGNDRLDITIASVRPIAFFTWIARLEAQGVRVETMTAQPGPTAGSLAVQAVLARGDGQ